jgi:aspartyl-tRNA(Asn)/glutamyl-tRNA(Gln) amidotransferase subunit C
VPFTEDDVRKLARLAQLRLQPGQEARVAGDLEALLAWIAQLQAIDVEGASETVHLGASEAPLRPDAARTGLPREILTRDAPSAVSGLFEVPRVLSRGPARPAGASVSDDDAADQAPP